jgi:hypothetical protein
MDFSNKQLAVIKLPAVFVSGERTYVKYGDLIKFWLYNKVGVSNRALRKEIKKVEQI